MAEFAEVEGQKQTAQEVLSGFGGEVGEANLLLFYHAPVVFEIVQKYYGGSWREWVGSLCPFPVVWKSLAEQLAATLRDFPLAFAGGLFMARRTGAPTILMIARRLCQLITKYQSVIILVYPSATALHAALAAAAAACQTLREELDATIPLGD